ncbi:MAG: DUF4300 family protein [Verrucomicrobiota bacterium]|jgi:hypothetical protein
MKDKFFSLLFFSLLVGTNLDASPIKISFLDNEDAIKQTTEFLLAKGCDQETVSSFRRVIDWYNSTPTDLDLRKFPPRKNGFYVFQSVSNLVEALPHPLIYTYHQNELNCFDTVILLAGSLINTKVQPDDISGLFLSPFTMTNGDVTLRVAATPRDAFAIICPPWWIEASKSIFSGSMQNKRICLTAAFDSFYFLPASTTRENLKNTLLKILQSNWKRQGITFPKNVEVVIYHSVALNEHNSLASHAGLLFQDYNQYIYIEKAGASGPYVRLDFTDKSDLFTWHQAGIKPTTDKRNFLFATFNDHEIEALNDIPKNEVH